MIASAALLSKRSSVIRLENVDCPVEVRRSSRAKRFSLKVSHTERAAILTLPPRGRVEDANAFLSRHVDWLNRQIERLPEPVPFKDGAVLPLRGEFYRLSFRGLQRNRGLVWVEGSTGSDASPLMDWQTALAKSRDANLPALCINGESEHAARRLADWLKAEVRRDLNVYVETHAKTLGCSPKRIGIRDQATRWGSCSTTGTLSFSWRLIFAPPFILDYVAAHEVAHLREMNHGPSFWRLVRDAFPGMQKARLWLKAYGSELHRFGAEA